MRLFRTIIPFMFFILLPVIAFSYDDGEQFCKSEIATPASTRNGFELVGRTAASPVNMDGVLEKAEWESAAVADDFIQFEPLRGRPSAVKTRAFVLYDSNALRIAFQACDPEEPVAQLTRRDVDLFNDDSVIVLLDSHHDGRSAYYFMVKCAGNANGRPCCG